MSEEPKTRADRRIEQRERHKDFAGELKELRALLAGRPNDGFKSAVLLALQRLEECGHANAMASLLILRACMDCEARDDGTAARLLLYVSGVVVEPSLTEFVLRTVLSAQQMVSTATGMSGVSKH